MRLFLLICIIAFSAKLTGQDTVLLLKNHNVNKFIQLLKTDNDLKNASIGFLAVDTKTKEIVAELNPDLSLMPASTLKVITTCTAFEILGNNFRYTTSLEYSGYIDTLKHILHGNIYIKGGGDPALGSIHFDKTKSYEFFNTWTSAIKKMKIDSITGSIIADASKYSNETANPKWLWEDVGNYYGAGPSGLTVFDNLYEIHLQSPKEEGLLTKVIQINPEIPGLKINNEVLSSNINADEAFVFGAPYQYLHEIRGTIPKAKDDFDIKAAIPDPALFLAFKFNEYLKLAGIKTNNEVNTIRQLILNGDTIKPQKKLICSTFSPSLTEIADITNKKSINLFAEHLLFEIGYAQKKIGNYNSSLESVFEFWKNKGMEMDGFYMYDGSGLSRSNAITSRQMVFILNYMKWNSKSFTAFYNTLPVAGESGTLYSVGKNTSAHGMVHAKSGSIDRVRAYAGYVITKSKRELAFNINISNYNCSDSECRKKLTNLMIAMSEFNL